MELGSLGNRLLCAVVLLLVRAQEDRRWLGKLFFVSTLLACRAPVDDSKAFAIDATANVLSDANAIAEVFDASTAPVAIDAGKTRAPFELTMTDEAHGWAIFLDGKRGTLEATSTGGTSWNVIRPLGAYDADYGFVVSAAFPDRTHAVLAWQELVGDEAVNEGAHLRIERTDDAGKTWKVTHLTAPHPVMSGLSLSFASPRDGFFHASIMSGMSSAPGFGPTWTTHDGGATWRSGPVANISGFYMGCSTCPPILREPLKLPPPLRCTGAYHTDSYPEISADLLLDETPRGDGHGNEILIASCPSEPDDSGPGNFRGHALFARHQGNAAWRFSSVQPDDAFIVLLKPDLFWRASDDRFDASSDGGKTWHAATMPSALGNRHSGPGGSDDALLAFPDIRVQFISPSVGFVFFSGKWLARTDDGGASWRDL